MATAKIPGMSKGEQGVKNQFKGINLLISPEPSKQLCGGRGVINYYLFCDFLTGVRPTTKHFLVFQPGSSQLLSNFVIFLEAYSFLLTLIIH